MYSYAIIGFGALGRSHAFYLDKMSKKRGDIYLKAICGTTAEEFSKSISLNLGSVNTADIDIKNCSFYDDYKELIEKEKPDIIISAMPTFLHKEVAVFALNNGCHVFSEKPMAITPEACENMMNAAEKNNRRLMIGQCLRFDAAYAKLKEYIDKETWGKPYRAEFARYSKMPRWTVNNWILDPAQSGGCILDMHVHDVDLINWFFGVPDRLDSVVTHAKCELESVFTRYYYDDGLFVTANADWSLTDTYPFKSHYMVNFEKAVAEILNGALTVYTEDEAIAVKLPETSYFEKEMESFINWVADGIECDEISAKSVYNTMKIAFEEINFAKAKEQQV